MRYELRDTSDEYCMQQALELAIKAEQEDEVPVGALLVLNNEIIGEGYNQPISTNDPTGHAEIIALRAAALHQDNYRLPGATLYVTLEPCVMCAGAIIHARLSRVVFGAYDAKAGAVSSVFNILGADRLNHMVDVTGGVMESECAGLLQEFFRKKR